MSDFLNGLDTINPPQADPADVARLKAALERAGDCADILAMLFPTDEQPRLGHVHGTDRRAALNHRARTAKGVRHG